MENLTQYLSGGITILISAIFLISGMIQYLLPPKKINNIYGYRTHRSKKNQANWDYAQRMNTKSMMIFSVIFLVLSLVINLMISYFIPTFNNIAIVPIILVVIMIMLCFFGAKKNYKSIEKNNTEYSISI